MEKFIELRINLSATEHHGRYTISSKTYNVQKQTPKTIIIQKSHGPHRIQKSEVLKAHSDFKNNSINRLQFYTYCLEKDYDTAIDLLKGTIQLKVDYLCSINVAALTAFETGPEITKN